MPTSQTPAIPARQTHHADVLIVTVTQTEGQAVIDAFLAATGQKSIPLLIGERTYRDLGTVGGARVWMAISEMGSGGLGGSQETVRLAIAALQPASVIMVGIAFGVDKKKQTMGQVLVAQQLLPYELQRVGSKDSPLPRGDKAHASPRLIEWLTQANLDWHDAAGKAKFGLILAGAKLIDNQVFRDQVIALASEAIGGEMEGEGLYVACHNAKTDWVLVKAICDWADGNKGRNKDANQKLAASNAARFVVHALQSVPLVNGGYPPIVPTSNSSKFPSIAPAALSLPKAVSPQEQLSSLLAWCDRGEILLKLEEFLRNDNAQPIHLLCFSDHVRNQPGKLLARVATELQEKLPDIRLKVIDTKYCYGFETSNGLSGLERFGKTMLEACAIKNEAALLAQMQSGQTDALILWHTDECTHWSSKKIELLLETARRWLGKLAASGEVGVPLKPVILVLILRYDDVVPSLPDKLLRRPDVKKKMQMAYSKACTAPDSLAHLALHELLILPDYSREDYRRWLNLDKVRAFLGGSLAKFEDEELIARHFPKGTIRYTELLKFLEQHQFGSHI
ncbi:MAG: hypothetical protein RL748_4206 [Pseudomonadota bacterium]|jgi:nucleoside phosphorylase